MSQAPSGFLRGLTALASGDVDFVIVGVGGINFYARDPAQIFSTVDLDVLLAPDRVNLRKALAALEGSGFAFEVGGEPFFDQNDELILGNVVAAGGVVSAVHEDGGQLDLMLSVRGFSYSDLARDAQRFTVGGTEVRVGRLEKLLRSKELSGRPKDVEFLRHFESRASEEADDT